MVSNTAVGTAGDGLETEAGRLAEILNEHQIMPQIGTDRIIGIPPVFRYVRTAEVGVW